MTRETGEDLGSRAVPGNTEGEQMIADARNPLREFFGCDWFAEHFVKDLEGAADRLRRAADFVDGKAAFLYEQMKLAHSQPEWRPIDAAPKDGTPILALLKNPIPRPGREDLVRWYGVRMVVRHPGIAADGWDMGWNMAAPVGHGGFPDDWFDGWMPLPAPEGSSEAHPSVEGRRANPDNSTSSEV